MNVLVYVFFSLKTMNTIFPLILIAVIGTTIFSHLSRPQLSDGQRAKFIVRV